MAFICLFYIEIIKRFTISILKTYQNKWKIEVAYLIIYTNDFLVLIFNEMMIGIAVGVAVGVAVGIAVGDVVGIVIERATRLLYS